MVIHVNGRADENRGSGKLGEKMIKSASDVRKIVRERAERNEREKLLRGMSSFILDKATNTIVGFSGPKEIATLILNTNDRYYIKNDNVECKSGMVSIAGELHRGREYLGTLGQGRLVLSNEEMLKLTALLTSSLKTYGYEILSLEHGQLGGCYIKFSWAERQ